MKTTALNAHNGASKRSKSKTRVVGRRKPKIALERVKPEIRRHPYLEGVKCREDGSVFVPASGPHKGHWTFGGRRPDGYLQATISQKHYPVHRLICEAFHGLCPPDKTDVDHINRDKADNRPENLRWATRSENCRNKSVCVKGMAGVVSQYVDSKAYRRALYANNPEYRERQKARCRVWRAKRKQNKEGQP